MNTIQVIYLCLFSILLYTFSLAMHLVICPGYLESHSIFDVYAESLPFVSYEISLIYGIYSLFSSISIFLILLPTSRIAVSSLLVLKNAKTIFCIYSPLSVVNISSTWIFSHSKHCSNSFFLETHILWSILKSFLVKYQRISSLCTFIKISKSLRKYFFNADCSFINSNFSLSQGLFLLFNLFYYPILFFEEVHLVEKHICSFLSLHKVVIKNLSISKKLGLV